MSYLKVVDLVDVVEAGDDVPVGTYSKTVEVVEIIDQDGNHFLNPDN